MKQGGGGGAGGGGVDVGVSSSSEGAACLPLPLLLAAVCLHRSYESSKTASHVPLLDWLGFCIWPCVHPLWVVALLLKSLGGDWQSSDCLQFARQSQLPLYQLCLSLCVFSFPFAVTLPAQISFVLQLQLWRERTKSLCACVRFIRSWLRELRNKLAQWLKCEFIQLQL